ncbi:MAG: hypothetical protein GQ569_09140 [Methylococcaceae bacterium]|nr:hypothetical protein [Methylococcaceae bacterium]
MSDIFPPFLQRLFNNNKRVDKRLRKQRFPLFLAHYLAETVPLVKIAGTNGKGSVSSMLESCCLEDNKQVGLFTSPHLQCLSERIHIRGVAVELEMMESEAQILSHQIDEFVKQQGENYQLAFFECLLIIALRLFKQAQVDIAIIEAGVGGYNDAVHFLDADVSAITSLGLDHPQQLGHSLQSVATDKVGIANANSTLIISAAIDEDLQRLMEDDCKQRMIELKIAAIDYSELSQNLEGSQFKLRLQNETLAIQLPLLGEFQLSNFAVVVSLWECLYSLKIVDRLSALQGVKNTVWAARMEYFESNPSILFDVAHNPQALEALNKTLDNLIPKARRVVLCGSSEDKDYPTSLKLFSSLSDNVYLCDGFYKAVSVNELQLQCPEAKACFRSPEQGLSYLQAHYAETDSCIIVAGSVFLVGAARAVYLEN